MEEELQVFLKEHESLIKPLMKQARLSYWNATLTGNKEDYTKYEQLQLEMEKIYNNPQEFRKIEQWYKNKNKIKDKILQRQLKILYLSYLSSQGDIKLTEKIVKLSTEIEHKFNTFRAKINDKELNDNEIKEILEHSKDSKQLEEAWTASKKQGELVEKQLIQLVKLRNQRAQALGFKNYYHLSLEIGEQKEQDISKIFKKMQELTDAPFQQLKQEIDLGLAEKYKIKPAELMPWHYKDLFFQEGPEIYKVNFDKYYNQDVIKIARKFYEDIGLPVEDILERSDLYDKKGKYQHAYCMDLDKEGDVRIMESVKNNEKWMDTNLHELGHAVYYKYMDRTLPFFVRECAHTFTTEAIAMLFGRNSKNLAFIRKYCGINDSESKKIEHELKKSLRLRQLVFSRWAQVMVNFEKAMYEKPDQDLNKLWYQLVQKFQLLNFERDKPDWASKIHLVSAPVYYHNYLLGEILASQIHHFIVSKILKQKELSNVEYSNKEIGKFLKEKIFSPGAKLEYQDMISQALGEELNPEYFVQQFCSD